MEKSSHAVSPGELWEKWKSIVKPEWKLSFLAALTIALFTHLPMMLSDIPNHDGLDSLYFDQNMITSGRWFLTVACGFSSYFSIPWVISLISIFLIALTAVVLTEFLALKNRYSIVLCSGLLAVFPTVASTFAYVFTMDGYMLALFLAVSAVLLTAKRRWGFLAGGVCLAFSLGTYQAYLPFAVLLSIYGILMNAMKEKKFSVKIKNSLHYLYMGIEGAGLYYIILQLLLWLEGKELASYQGINSGLESGTSLLSGGLVSLVKKIYLDFAAFTAKGNVVYNNGYALTACLVLAVLTIAAVLICAKQEKWYKSIWFYLIVLLLAAGLPVATNLILIISPSVTYHLLMRYQWVLYLILPIAFLDGFCKKQESGPKKKTAAFFSWVTLLAGFVLVFHYMITDNIAYSNLQKRYEKTYAYCVRLLDRIEQTPGYYQGIPIAMIGVVGDEPYPPTDLTGKVTSNMIGMNGDFLLYTGRNYELFIKNYLGATLNILEPEVMEEIYNSPEYREMESFPAPDSIRIVDGVLYIKTENMERGES